MHKNAIAAVLATNPAEALEYLHSYMSLEVIALMTVVVLLLSVIIYFTRKEQFFY
jgi:glucan phosphoethanolaminetransferase (alkaline phosphatase superfamily)